MKKTLALLVALLISVGAMAQKTELRKEVDKMLAEINDVYTINGDGKVQVQKVIELDSTYTKDFIFDETKEKLAVLYNNLSEVLETENRDKGVLTIKGLYPDVYCEQIFAESGVPNKAQHLLKIEAKDGRMRVTISILDVRKTYKDVNNMDTHMYYNLEEVYPINDGDRYDVRGRMMGENFTFNQKTREGFIFYDIIELMQGTISEIEKHITTRTNETDDEW